MTRLDDDEYLERIGRVVSTIFVAALAALFAYGYLGHLLFG
jgi:hypothetical protein